ncbi:MAG: hypothetical protein MZV65_30265 [Chromatiales bacterium]|nr:hypothetical protein [Chromatiales bacterium]
MVGTFCTNDEVVQRLPKRTLLNGDMSDDAPWQSLALSSRRAALLRMPKKQHPQS